MSAALSSGVRGITVRPPRLLLPDQQHAGSSFDPEGLEPLLHSGVLRRPEKPSVVVYRVRVGEHQQTGVVVEVSVDDYRNGRVRRHEATDPERERRLAEYTEQVGVEQTPVMLTHAPRPTLRDTLAGITSVESDMDYQTNSDQRHSVWVTDDPALVHAVSAELGALSSLYIADGHHRMAAADRYAAQRPGLEAEHPCGFTLGALFPRDEMRVFGYPRGISNRGGRTPEEILADLARAPGSAGIEPRAATDGGYPPPGTVAVFLDGRWYWLRLRGPRSDVRGALDTVRLDEAVIPSAFGGTDSISVPDASDPESLARWCSQHDAVGFLPHPPSVAAIMAVSDAGQLMPAKSTWFDPKAPQGLFVRELRHRLTARKG